MRIRTRALFIMMDKVSTGVLRLALGIVLVRLVGQADVGKEMLGSFRQVVMVGTFLSMLATFGIPDSVYYFLPPVSGAERRRRLTQILTLAVASGLLASGVMLFGSGPIGGFTKTPLGARTVQAFALFPLIDLMRQTLSGALIACDRAVHAALINVGSMIARLAVIIATFAAGWPLEAVLVSHVAVEVAGVSVLLLVHWRHGALGLVRPQAAFYREVLGYCVPLALAYAVGLLTRFLDRGLISRFFTADRFIEFDYGARQLPFIAVFTQSIATAVMPNLVAHFKKGEVRQMCELFAEGVRRSTVLLLPIFVWMLTVADDMVVILYTAKYGRAVYPFVVYLFVLPVRVALYAALLRAMGRTRPIFWIALITLASHLLVSFTLLTVGGDSLLGFVGPAIGTVTSIYVFAACACWLVRREINRQGYAGRVFPVREYLATLAVAGAAGLVALLVTRGLLSGWMAGPLTSALGGFGISGDRAADLMPGLLRWLRVGTSAAVVFGLFLLIGHRTGVVRPRDWDVLRIVFRRGRSSVPVAGEADSEAPS
jgi:O-antigen/teichoic acid export membrane protein